MCRYKEIAEEIGISPELVIRDERLVREGSAAMQAYREKKSKEKAQMMIAKIKI